MNKQVVLATILPTLLAFLLLYLGVILIVSKPQSHPYEYLFKNKKLLIVIISTMIVAPIFFILFGNISLEIQYTSTYIRELLISIGAIAIFYFFLRIFDYIIEQDHSAYQLLTRKQRIDSKVISDQNERRHVVSELLTDQDRIINPYDACRIEIELHETPERDEEENLQEKSVNE